MIVKYEEPIMEVLRLEDEDVVTLSNGGTGGNNGGDSSDWGPWS